MKGKIIFINPPIFNYDKIYDKVISIAYPFPGLMILSTILDKAGYRVELIDANLYRPNDFLGKLFSKIDDSVVFIGFSLMTMNVSWAYPVIKETKRKFPNHKIVTGGVHPSLFPEEMIENEHIDVTVINEATSTIAALADTLLNNEDLSKIPGIYYKENKKIFKNPPNLELDSFENVPFINFPLIKHENYIRNNGLTAFQYFPKKDYMVYPIQTSFGCAYRCTFCINSILKRKYRMRSAEEIVNRIEFLQKEYNANFIAFYDEDFFVSKKRSLRFIELVEKKKLKFLWRTSLRVNYFRDDYLNDELLKRLDNTGFLCAVMGGESGNQRILDYLNKGITVEQILNSVKALSKTAIVPKISFMVGIPGETEKEIMQTYRFVISLKKIAKKADLSVLAFRLYPGSKIYEAAVSDYQYKEITNLKEWSSVSEQNLKRGWGYPSKDRRWIENPGKFDLMQFYFNTFIWPYYEKKGLLRHLFVKIVMARFRMNFFRFSFIEKTIYGIYMCKNLFKRGGRKKFLQRR